MFFCFLFVIYVICGKDVRYWGGCVWMGGGDGYGWEIKGWDLNIFCCDFFSYIVKYFNEDMEVICCCIWFIVRDFVFVMVYDFCLKVYFYEYYL